MVGKSPCMGCTNRSPACHGSCEAYKGWLEQYRAEQKHFQDNKDRWQVPWTAARERSIRSDLNSGFRKRGGVQ